MAPPSAPKNVAPIAPSPAPSPVAETTPPAPESSPLPPDADLPTAEAPIPDPPPTEVVAPEIQPAVAETPGSSLLSDPKLESTPPPVAKIVPEETPADPAVLQEPRAALQAFLAASGWKERLPLIQNGEALRPIIEEYYANHSDGPIKADSIDFLTSQPTPDEKGVFFLFQVQVHDEHGFPVAVENMQGNYRIDWRSFVEFKDLLLPKFFERYSPDPATFHVVLKRSHYFGSDVPDQEHKLCFSAEPPVPGFQNYVWVSDDSQALITKLGVRSEFGQTAYPVVSLRWLKEKNGTAYVLLDDIVSDNWRADEARAVLPVKPKSPKKR